MMHLIYVSFSLFLTLSGAFGKPDKIFQQDASFPKMTSRSILRATLMTLSLSSIFRQNNAASIGDMEGNFGIPTRNQSLLPVGSPAGGFDFRDYIQRYVVQASEVELPCFTGKKGRSSKKFLEPELRDAFIAYQLQKQIGKKADGLSAAEKKHLFLIRWLVPQEIKEFLIPRSSPYVFYSFFDSWLESSTHKQRCKLGRAAKHLGMEKIDFRGDKWRELKKLSSSEKENLVEAFFFNESRKSIRQWIQKGMPISSFQALTEVFPEEACDKGILKKWSVIERNKKIFPKRDFRFFTTQRSYKAPGRRIPDRSGRRLIADSVILFPKLPEINLESFLAENWISKGFSANYISANSSGNCTLVRWVNPGPYRTKLANEWVGERAITVLVFVNEEKVLEPCQLEHLRFVTQDSKNISITYLGSEKELARNFSEDEIAYVVDIRSKLQLAPLPVNLKTDLKLILPPA